MIAVLWLIPTAGLFVATFRSWGEQQVSGWWMAFLDGSDGWSLDMYRYIFRGERYATGLLNQAAIAVPATIVPVLFSAAAGYAFARLRFAGRHWWFIITVALIAIPFQTTLIPLLQLYSGGAHWTIPLVGKTITVIPDLDLAGTTVAVWLTHVGFAIPFGIFLTHNAITALPDDLFDSARVDGASHTAIFWRIVVPLIAPTLAALVILQFLFTWNDFLIALTMIGGTSPDALPATVIFSALSVPAGASDAAMVAVHSAIGIGAFLALQRYMIRGLLAGIT
jgi:alpha-glucoside transport system permease protein